MTLTTRRVLLGAPAFLGLYVDVIAQVVSLRSTLVPALPLLFSTRTTTQEVTP